MIPANVEKMLYLSLSATAPGSNVRYFDSEKEGAAGQVPIRSEDATNRLLKRNSTHFLEIIIPRQPIDSVFRLTRADQNG